MIMTMTMTMTMTMIMTMTMKYFFEAQTKITHYIYPEISNMYILRHRVILIVLVCVNMLFGDNMLLVYTCTSIYKLTFII